MPDSLMPFIHRQSGAVASAVGQVNFPLTRRSDSAGPGTAKETP